MDDIKFLKLGLSKDELGENPLEQKKKINRILAQSRKRAKKDKCMYCHEEKSSFCNSHSVPAFCLKNIATDGSLYHSNTLIKVDLFDSEKGVKNAGTFQLICRDCDSKIFQEYEDPNNYEKETTPKMLSQIAMKNNLRHIGKRLNEYAMFDIASEINPLASGIVNYMQKIQKIDLVEYKAGFEKAKRLSQKNWKGEYYQFYYEKLDYVVPIAFQGSISLVVDLDGIIVNDIYNEDANYRIQDLHICVFPLKDSSIITMFIDSDNKRYRNFYKHFNKLSHDDKLSIVNYIIFLYSEDIFISKDIPEKVLKNDKLIEVSKQSSIALLSSPFLNAIEESKKVYDLSKRNEIPNLLNEEYKLR